VLNRTTLARPYARAAFEAARDADRLAVWSANLAFAAELAGSAQIGQFSGDPRVSRAQFHALISGLGQGRFDESFANFLRVLIERDRFELVPEIAVQFEHYRRQAEARVQVRVSSAQPLSDQDKVELVERLGKRFSREIELETEVDESLIAGAVVRAGDEVIDGSVRGRLEQLGQHLLS